MLATQEGERGILSHRLTIDKVLGLALLMFVSSFPMFAYLSPAQAAPSCLGQSATIIGTPGDDSIDGTPGDDVIAGRDGNDVINGRGGDDIICGDGGNDSLLGARGADEIDGGDGGDFLSGGTGPDRLYGGRGDDRIVGGSGDDFLDGRAGFDRHDGGPDFDVCVRGEVVLNCEEPEPEPEPEPTPSLTSTPTQTPSPSPTVTTSPSPSPTATTSPSPTATASPSPSPTVTTSPSPSATPPAPAADLSVAKVADPDPAIRGDTLTYTVTTTNNGPNTAQDAVLTDTIENPGFSEDFDGVTAPALPSGWTTNSTGGGKPWETSTFIMHVGTSTPPNSAFVTEPFAVSDHSLVSPVFTVGPNAVLSFDHQWRFDTSAGTPCSGGVLEIKIGAGMFTDILTSGGAFTADGYNGTIGDCPGANSPLIGRPAWVDSSVALSQTVVSLPPAAAGQSIQLRWRMGSDVLADLQTVGWNVDSISVPGSPLVFNLGDIAAGDSVVTVFTTTVPSNAEGPITNTATVSSLTPDPDPSNNTATITTSVVSGAGIGADLEADIITAPIDANTTDITFTVTNLGPSGVTDTSVSLTVSGTAPNSSVFFVPSGPGSTNSPAPTCSADPPTFFGVASFTLRCDGVTLNPGEYIHFSGFISYSSPATVTLTGRGFDAVVADPDINNNTEVTQISFPNTP